MDDVDMMDVDPCHQITMRKRKQIESQKDIVDAPESRIVLKALRRFTPSSATIAVLDTNILINHLRALKDLVQHLTPNCKVSLVLPLIVIQELDLFKKTNKIDKKCFQFINEQLKCGKWLISDVILFKRANKKMIDVQDIMEFNNDDKILRICLTIKKSFSQEEVILVTDDLNLINKAIASDLKAFNWSDFCHRWKFSSKTFDSEVSNSRPSQLFSFRDNVSNQTITKSTLSSSSYEQTQSQQSITDKGQSKKSLKRTYSEESNLDINDWLKVKYYAEKELSIFIEKILKQEYGDIWDQVFNINFQTCDLTDVIRVLKQGWIGTFGEAFQRNDEWKKKISRIYDLLKEGTGISELQQLLISLIEFITKKVFLFCDNEEQVAIKGKKMRKTLT